jgi:uncharacterized metal-binding protein YceD (DUF177 family)
MTNQHYFDTTKLDRRSAHPGRKLSILARHRLRDEIRKQRQIVANQRDAMQIKAMIASLGRSMLSLNADIDVELQRARVHDPAHFAFPMAARTMIARRDNLKVTIAALTEQLAKVDSSSTRMAAA